MGQLYWPESTGVSRYSIPSRIDLHHTSPSKVLLRQTYKNSMNIQTNEQTSKLLEIIEDNESPPNDIEHLYDGLISLDEDQLDQMIETDLVSSNGYTDYI